MKKTAFVDLKPGDRLGDYVVMIVSGTLSLVHVSTGNIDPLSDINFVFGKAPVPEVKTLAKPTKPRYVDLVRYVRPFTDELEIDNLRGVTFFIRLDYHLETIAFSFTTCNGVNFDKQAGVELAKANFNNPRRQFMLSMPMGGVSKDGVLTDIWNKMKTSKFLDHQTKKQFIDAGFSA